jgi:hypothetical protein
MVIKSMTIFFGKNEQRKMGKLKVKSKKLIDICRLI